MANRQWRIREASALALADLMIGSDVRTMETSFEDIWKMSLRILDDIKVCLALVSCTKRMPAPHPAPGPCAPMHLGIGASCGRDTLPAAGRDHRPSLRPCSGTRAMG